MTTKSSGKPIALDFMAASIPREGEAPEVAGAHQARWQVDDVDHCPGSEGTPPFGGLVPLELDSTGFDLPVGTLARPALAGDEICESELAVWRINNGLFQDGFCEEARIVAIRRDLVSFRSGP